MREETWLVRWFHAAEKEETSNKIKNLRNTVRVLCVQFQKWLWRMSTSRTRQVSTKVNGKTCEKLRQSAERSAAVPEQCGKEDLQWRGRAESLGFSACQGLWKIAGRSPSRAGV
jgi:hypothetical protein